jgi:hypothetical protein
LNTPASGQVRLTILDDKDKEIRTLTGTQASGLNRVWWDLRSTARARATGDGGAEQPEPPPGGEGRPPANPLVAPGVYTVKLTVDGRDLTTKLTVRKDPERPLR